MPKVNINRDHIHIRRDHTLKEFEQNLHRVTNLISVYELLHSEQRGRRSVPAADVLRAAVMFLHSALEEVFRNLFVWRLPMANSEIIDTIPLVGERPGSPAKGFLLGKLVPHSNSIVHNIIRDSIASYVDQMNINNIPDLVRCLSMLGLTTSDYDIYYPALAAAMTRRHQIAHQMDRNHAHGPGAHHAKSISVRQVMAWQTNLSNFAKAVIQSVPD